MAVTVVEAFRVVTTTTVVSSSVAVTVEVDGGAVTVAVDPANFVVGFATNTCLIMKQVTDFGYCLGWSYERSIYRSRMGVPAFLPAASTGLLRQKRLSHVLIPMFAAKTQFYAREPALQERPPIRPPQGRSGMSQIIFASGSETAYGRPEGQWNRLEGHAHTSVQKYTEGMIQAGQCTGCLYERE